MRVPAPQLVSEAEYLRQEEDSLEKHEYLGGVVYAQAGASGSHVRIVGNIGYALTPQVRQSGCRLQSGMKLCVGQGVANCHPDLMVRGGPPPHSHFETAPSLLIEVQRESTRSIDEREKRIASTSIPSVRADRIASQDERRVTVHARGPDGWAASEILGRLSLDEISFGVLDGPA